MWIYLGLVVCILHASHTQTAQAQQRHINLLEDWHFYVKRNKHGKPPVAAFWHDKRIDLFHEQAPLLYPCYSIAALALLWPCAYMAHKRDIISQGALWIGGSIAMVTALTQKIFRQELTDTWQSLRARYNQRLFIPVSHYDKRTHIENQAALVLPNNCLVEVDAKGYALSSDIDEKGYVGIHLYEYQRGIFKEIEKLICACKSIHDGFILKENHPLQFFQTDNPAQQFNDQVTNLSPSLAALDCFNGDVFNNINGLYVPTCIKTYGRAYRNSIKQALLNAHRPKAFYCTFSENSDEPRINTDAFVADLQKQITVTEEFANQYGTLYKPLYPELLNPYYRNRQAVNAYQTLWKNACIAYSKKYPHGTKDSAQNRKKTKIQFIESWLKQFKDNAHVAPHCTFYLFTFDQIMNQTSKPSHTPKPEYDQKRSCNDRETARKKLNNMLKQHNIVQRNINGNPVYEIPTTFDIPYLYKLKKELYLQLGPDKDPQSVKAHKDQGENQLLLQQLEARKTFYQLKNKQKRTPDEESRYKSLQKQHGEIADKIREAGQKYAEREALFKDAQQLLQLLQDSLASS